ncbi:MAG: VWA domain-containing protein [Pseudomonadota bacterium]
MKFSDPHMFYMVWVVVLAAGVTVYGHHKRKRIVSRYASPKALASVAPEFSPVRPWVKGIIQVAALGFLVVCLAGPQWGFRWETIEQKGVDIMICLDCSRSMLAQDIEPTRLERAKREIIDLLRMMKSDRAGLVAFAGSAILQCPLTLDHEAFNLFLQSLTPDFLPMGGTDLAGAIEAAMSGFEAESDTDKAIILITDGENTAGDPLAAADKAADSKIKLFCIGVGKTEGAPVPDTEGGFKKDSQGRIILSKVDDNALSDIAARGKGIYVKSVAGDMDLDMIYTREIRGKMELKTVKSGRKKVWENRFQWFLFPGILLLIMEMFIRDFRKKGRNLAALFLIPILAALAPGQAHAGASASVDKGIEAYNSGKFDEAEKHFIDAQLARPDMPELYYNIGTAAYKKGDFKSAQRNFEKAMESQNPGLKTNAQFNLGNTYYRMGDLDKAVKTFENLVKDHPEDTQAKENLEFIRKKQSEEKPPPPQDQQNKDQDKKDQDQQKQDQGQQNQDKDKQNRDKQDQTSDNYKDQKDKSGQQPGEQPESAKDQNQGAGTPPPPEQNQEDMKNQGGQPGQEEQKGNEHQGQESGAMSAQQASKTDPGEPPRDSQGLERMLNRLEDKPGQALAPAYKERQVTKDW